MKLGILGKNISYSLSPVLHKLLCREAGYGDIEYTIFDVPPEDLPKTIRRLTQENFTGINVTIPYKKTILQFCERFDESAELCGSANTLHWDQNRITALNTDLSGLLNVFRTLNIQTFSRSVIFGYGGVAPAVVVALKKSRVPNIEIFGRSSQRIKDFSDQFDVYVHNPAKSFAGTTLWINATPAGSVNHPEIPGSFFITPNRGDFFLDLNYSPVPTNFQQYFISQGIETAGGLDMLIEQAVDSQKLWRDDPHFGEDLDRALIKKQLISAMG